MCQEEREFGGPVATARTSGDSRTGPPLRDGARIIIKDTGTSYNNDRLEWGSSPDTSTPSVS